MAPNRKNISSLLETLSSNDLQSLQNTVQPKFLPLTHPKEEQQQPKPETQQVESVSYWDWSPEVEQEPIDLFSAASIQSNLIQAANAITESESQRVADHDDYWADQSLAPTVPVTQPQHIECSYWQWPAEQDSKKATIDRILAEERAYELVSGATTEATEIAAETPVSCHVEPSKVANNSYWIWQSLQVAAHTLDASHPSNKYWDWDAQAAQVQSPLQALLEYEAAREFLTAANIVRQLQESQPVEAHRALQASSDDYWSDCQANQYWDMPAAAVVSTGQGYWDM
jgi:hypothetical protein